MSTNFPTNLDTLTNPTATDSVATVSHSSQHANANDAIEALQSKVGVDSSAVTTSHDYKLSEVTSTDKAVGKTAVQTLTNKTLTSPTVNGATVSGTITDSSTRTVTGSVDAGGASSFEIPNSASPTVNDNGEIAVDTSVADFSHGILKYYGGEEMAAVAVPITELVAPNEGDVVTYNATTDEFELRQPTTQQAVAPSYFDIKPLNPSSDAPRTVTVDKEVLIAHSNAGVGFSIAQDDYPLQTRNTTTDWADADEVRSIVVMGLYAYVLVTDSGTTPDTHRVYRYLLSDLTSSPTQMTFSGSNQLTTSDSIIQMAGDGTNLYLNFLAGNSANSYVIGKYTVSGTTITYSSTITLSGSPTLLNGRFVVNTSGEIYILESVNSYLYKYNSDGSTNYTSTKSVSGTYDDGLLMYGSSLYVFNSTDKVFIKIPA